MKTKVIWPQAISREISKIIRSNLERHESERAECSGVLRTQKITKFEFSMCCCGKHCVLKSVHLENQNQPPMPRNEYFEDHVVVQVQSITSTVEKLVYHYSPSTVFDFASFSSFFQLITVSNSNVVARTKPTRLETNVLNNLNLHIESCIRCARSRQHYICFYNLINLLLWSSSSISDLSVLRAPISGTRLGQVFFRIVSPASCPHKKQR